MIVWPNARNMHTFRNATTYGPHFLEQLRHTPPPLIHANEQDNIVFSVRKFIQKYIFFELDTSIPRLIVAKPNPTPVSPAHPAHAVTGANSGL